MVEMMHQVIAYSSLLILIVTGIAILCDVFFYSVTMTTMMLILLLGMSICGVIDHWGKDDE